LTLNKFNSDLIIK